MYKRSTKCGLLQVFLSWTNSNQPEKKSDIALQPPCAFEDSPPLIGCSQLFSLSVSPALMTQHVALPLVSEIRSSTSLTWMILLFDDTGVFVALNILQHRLSHLHSALAIRKPRYSHVAPKIAALTPEIIDWVAKHLEDEKDAGCLTSEEKNVFTLVNELTTISAHIPGLSASKLTDRNEIHSYFVGVPADRMVSDGSASADADGLFYRLGSTDGHPTNPRIAADDWQILPDDCTVGQTKYKYPLLLTTT